MNIDPNLPVNKIAALVVSKSDEKGVKINKDDQIITKIQPLLTDFTGPEDCNLTGKKAGRFLVIGVALYRAKRKSNAIRWVVKCSCGNYQFMRSVAIKKNIDNPEMACLVCQQTRHLSFRIRNKIDL